MLTIAEVSGLIAAAVMIIQYLLPAALVVILVKYVGTENSAGTWSVVNRTISTTIWPHLLRADAVKMSHVPLTTKITGWVLTFSAFLLVVASVLAPLGLRDEIVPRESRLVQFEYVPDRGPWGRVTMPRPESKFTRYCEFGLIINCPGQYQGVYMNETEPGNWRSVETNADSTINLTIPENYTAMFSSATSDLGSTVSGLFDIQYRRWSFDRSDIQDKGQPFVRGDSRYIQSLITQEKIVLVEGLVVDMRSSPGIGFRNHTIPVGLEHGGTWTEDLTWIEPVTRCADTNLSIQFRDENTEDFDDERVFSIIDRGAFTGLDVHTLESPAWIDNQTLDLFGRAHKAARMHNVLVASSLNVTLPLDPATKTLPAIEVKDTSSASAYMFSYQPFDRILMDYLTGVGGAPPNITGFTHSNKYSDGSRRLVALNYSAITQVCRGYYELLDTEIDYRANNITNPLVECGFVLGAQLESFNSNLSVSTYNNGISTYSRNLYVCASSVRASIKSVGFRYNGTGGQLSNLEATEISHKVYPDEQSKPLWAVESSWPKIMRFDPLWGMVDRHFEEFGGFNTLRAENLWLPASPFLTYANFGEGIAYDALAGASGFARRLGNLYGSIDKLDTPDYSGQYEYTLLERWHRLSHNEDMASQIPSLIMTDGLAAALVGTKTSISKKYVQYPASLAVDDTVRGYPQARVTVYKRVIRYDMRYAIPGLIVLAILLLALVWSLAIFLTSRMIIWMMRNVYNQTSAGRLATNLLRPGRSDPKQSTKDWTSGDGRLVLSFGRISPPEKDYFCAIVNDTTDAKQSPDSDSGKTPSSLGKDRGQEVSTSAENKTVITSVAEHDNGGTQRNSVSEPDATHGNLT